MLDEEQHQQAAGEVENVRNSVMLLMHNFRNFRWCNLVRILQIIADIICITNILSQRYRYMAHHYSLAIRQAFWKLPDVTHFWACARLPVPECPTSYE